MAVGAVSQIVSSYARMVKKLMRPCGSIHVGCRPRVSGAARASQEAPRLLRPGEVLRAQPEETDPGTMDERVGLAIVGVGRMGFFHALHAQELCEENATILMISILRKDAL